MIPTNNQKLKTKTNKKTMPINVDLLSKICKTPGAPGFEQKVRELVIREIEPFVDAIEVDNMGNVSAIK
ncbi:MAG: hypothetical protein JKY54_16155, partial [Flavobacteriales bacterium]|nr:hypothetical protein [Flavobacteriales bacterium]